MKEIDNMEEFMSKVREDFNQNEPNFGHFNRFAEKLELLHKQNAPRKSTRFGQKQYAIASLIGLLICSMFLISKLNNNSKALVGQTINPRVEITTEHNDNEQVVNRHDQQFATINNHIEIAQTTKTFTELEMQYIELKQHFIEYQNEESLLAIKQNLEQRLVLLDDALEESQKATMSFKKTTKNELLTKASNCFGIPQDDSNKYLGKQTNLYASN